MEQFFEPSVSAIHNIVRDICDATAVEISVRSKSFLCLLSQLNHRPFFLSEGLGRATGCITISKMHSLLETSAARKTKRKCVSYWAYPFNSTPCFRNKAVADGAVSYHIDHLVTNRIARYSYGVGATYPYNASNPEHTARPDLVYTEIDGSQCIAGYFSTILSKVS